MRGEKVELRRSMNERRAALSASEVAARSAVLCGRVLTRCHERKARRVALYAAIRNEVDLSVLADALEGAAIECAYPRTDPPARLTFHKVASRAELVPTGRYQIPEPPPTSPELAPDTLDVILVPGLAFDASGHRIGWGAGYYDALLPLAKRALRIGVCYDFQLVERCPRGAADEPVHEVITETQSVIANSLIKENTP